MKFKCGECGSNYRVNTENITTDGIVIMCRNCNNKFTINGFNMLNSSTGNSKVKCNNCGVFLDENISACTNCNLVLNKNLEELRIDNNYYDKFEVDQNGNIVINSKYTKKKVLAFASSLTIFVTAALSVYQYKNELIEALPDNILKHIKTEVAVHKSVIIMKNGETIFAAKINESGNLYKVTTENGLIVQVLKSNVLQVSEATIRKF